MWSCVTNRYWHTHKHLLEADMSSQCHEHCTFMIFWHWLISEHQCINASLKTRTRDWRCMIVGEAMCTHVAYVKIYTHDTQIIIHVLRYGLYPSTYGCVCFDIWLLLILQVCATACATCAAHTINLQPLICGLSKHHHRIVWVSVYTSRTYTHV